MTFLRRSRAMLALAVGNWLSRGYLAVVGLTAGYAIFEDVYLDPADASMSYVVPMLLTAPLNWPFTIAFGWIPTDAPFYLGIALGAVVNAVVLGAIVRAVRRRRPSTARPAPSA
ncbi:SCO4225 family membrane protein [Streptomyces phyllanthi]|uniref:Uncharacterized protein n=1 Tax=Streptomyces phyllanthi TaxID=1803180 RepID=A0A5N8W1E9_9ACTN|nr:hypothetical protein [Streptomyces phyllanthi]MPY41089.1 hypothetical protein [Streptomyces phyllanthi]